MARMIAETLAEIQRQLDAHSPDEQAQARAFIDARYPSPVSLVGGVGSAPDEPVQRVVHEPVQNQVHEPVLHKRVYKAFRASSESFPESFLSFWSEYPRKTGKQEALRIWLRLNPDQERQARILAAVRQQKTSDDWTKDNGQFIPHPKTWLNQGRWDDEPVQIGSSTGAKRGSFAQRLWDEAQREKRGEK